MLVLLSDGNHEFGPRSCAMLVAAGGFYKKGVLVLKSRIFIINHFSKGFSMLSNGKYVHLLSRFAGVLFLAMVLLDWPPGT